MECPSCRTEQSDGGRFCMECGVPMPSLCPSCGTPNPPNAKFCGECGAKIAEPIVLKERLAASPTALLH